AAVRVAVEMADEGLIDKTEAVLRVDPRTLDQLLHPRLDPQGDGVLLATGLPASPGASSGRISFDPDTAEEWAERGEAVILIRNETSPDGFPGTVAAKAVVTARGGMTSHAAVVARGMGQCCVVGANELSVGAAGRTLRAVDPVLDEGDWVTVDGTNGRLLLGRVGTVEPEPSEDFQRVMSGADEFRRLGVRTNADTPEDAAKAREFGAEGIGL